MDKIVWKQMLPIPKSKAIYIPAEQDDGHIAWEDVEKTSGWTYLCLVMYERHYTDCEGNAGIESDIGVYCLDYCGTGELEPSFKMVHDTTGLQPPILPYPMGLAPKEASK